MRAYVGIANLLTSASLAAGLLAVLLASEGRVGWALVAVVVAAALDSVDGLVARRTGACGAFGCHLDSLADLVAFGVAPAFLLARGPLADAPVLGGAVAVAFAVAGAWRLARFPLVQDREHFVGLPIPPSGLIVAGVAALEAPTVVAVLVPLVLAVLMLGSFTVPTLAEIGQLVRRRPARPAPGRVRARRSGARRSGGRPQPGPGRRPVPRRGARRGGGRGRSADRDADRASA